MFDDILAAIPFGIILSITVGPVFFVFLETSATKGFKAALVFDLGVVLQIYYFCYCCLFSTSTLNRIYKKGDSNFLIIRRLFNVRLWCISFIKTIKIIQDYIKEYQKVKIQKNYFQLFLKAFFKFYKYWCFNRMAWLYCYSQSH